MTKHMDKRMNQRGISGDMVDLVLEFGRCDGDRLVLDRRDLDSLLDDLRRKRRVAIKLMDKGGVVVVERGNALLTTWNLDRSRRSSGGRGRRR